MPQITQREFGRLADGRLVFETTLDNGRGLSLSAINLGGAVTALHTPDRDGCSANIVLAHGQPQAYEHGSAYLGAIVGRYANRIAGGRFVLDGQVVELARNQGRHCLHGGPDGLHRRWWDITAVPDGGDGCIAIDLHCVSEHGDNGFPGRLVVTVRYSLTPNNDWRIDYHATTDAPTMVNLSHHSYFNLSGQVEVDSGNSVHRALDHWLSVRASRFLAVDADVIPTRMTEVESTPFDFRQPRRIGDLIDSDHEQLRLGQGYDHNWVVDRPAGTMALVPAARLVDDTSGRAMEILTTEPGIQVYSGNFLDKAASGHARRSGVCLETQHFPDAPNRPDFASTLLRPGEVWRSTTVHRFSTVGRTDASNARR